MKPCVLGVTGGIGSGKSCVSRLLSSYCLAPLIDVDKCCRYLLEIDQPGWCALRAELANGFFLKNGALNRKALREHIFNDAEARRQVDTLLHPLAREAMHAQIRQQHAPLVVVEIPLLYEAGWREEVNAVVVVYARRGVRCYRIMRRDGVSRQAATRAMAVQMRLKDKAELADFVIDNSRDWTVTRTEVVALGNELPKRFSKRGQESA